MRTQTHVITIDRDPHSVWVYLSDPCNDSKWRQEIVRTELLDGAAGETGTRYRETLTWEGMHADASLTIAESVPGVRLVVVAEDPGYESVSEWDFEPEEDGTRVSLTFCLETKGPLRLVEPFMWAMVNRWLERDLAALPAVLNGASPAHL